MVLARQPFQKIVKKLYIHRQGRKRKRKPQPESCCCSVAQSCLTSLQVHELQHTRLLCPSLSPWVCWNSCPFSQWCHSTISCSVFPFFSSLKPFLASAFFLLNQLFALDGHSIGASGSASFEYSGLISFRIDWFDLPDVQETLRSLCQHHSSKASILQHSALFMVQLSYPHMTTGKTIALTIQTFVSKVMSLLFNMLFRFFIAFLQRIKHLLISWMQQSSTKKIKSVTVSIVSPSICYEVMGLDAMIFVFWM